MHAKHLSRVITPLLLVHGLAIPVGVCSHADNGDSPFVLVNEWDRSMQTYHAIQTALNANENSEDAGDDPYIPVIGPNTNELQLPDGHKHILVSLADGQYAKNILLPVASTSGATVTISRTSKKASWVQGAGLNLKVGNNATIVLRFDGDRWQHTTTTKNDVIKLHGSAMYEVALTDMAPEELIEQSVVLTNIRSEEKPGQLDLNNITISGEVISNLTSYTLNELIVRKKGKSYQLKFETALPPYSSATLPAKWHATEVANATVISNSRIDFQSSSVPSGYPNSRQANAAERDSAERMMMYDRFMFNDPQTLFSVLLKHFETYCDTGGDAFSECHSYGAPLLDYVTDTYFAKAVSGINVLFWIDPDVWGLAVQPGQERIKSTRSHAVNLWMNPDLMNNIHSSDRNESIDAWQALAHEYYHNHGFSHYSGWPSSWGIDDLFGAKTKDHYLEENGTAYITSNIVVEKMTSEDGLNYRVQLKSTDSADGLTMRLLSTEPVAASVRQRSENILRLKFTEIPKSDVYLSFYNEDSRQMSTVILDRFVYHISSQGPLSSFNDTIESLLKEYSQVNVSTANGSWAGGFHLPQGEAVLAGRTVVFKSTASWSSTIHYNGEKAVLATGAHLIFRYNGQSWEQISTEG